MASSGSEKRGSRIDVRDWSFAWRMFTDPRNAPIHLMDAYIDGEVEIDMELTPLFGGLYEAAHQLRAVDPFLRWFDANAHDASSHEADVRHHYDLEIPEADGKLDPVEFYRLWLDSSMAYTMAYWAPGVRTLEEAQRRKNSFYCDLALIEPGHDVYEAGFGFGSFIPYVQERGGNWYGANLSACQTGYVREHHPELPVREQDFLLPWDEDGDVKRFDRIACIGALEHMQDLDACFRSFRRALKDDGRLVIHLITLNRAGNRSFSDPWLTTRVFPNGQLHTHDRIVHFAKPYFEVAFDHVFPGEHYARTLAEWRRRFERHTDKLEAMGAPDRFVRLWRAYLSAVEASFAKGFVHNSAFAFVPK